MTELTSSPNETFESKQSAANAESGNAEGEQWPGIDSRYRLIVVAALRSKQLQRGARPRIAPDLLKRRNTSIALEEVKQGLVSFTITAGEREVKADGQESGQNGFDRHN